MVVFDVTAAMSAGKYWLDFFELRGPGAIVQCTVAHLLFVNSDCTRIFVSGTWFTYDADSLTPGGTIEMIEMRNAGNALLLRISASAGARDDFTFQPFGWIGEGGSRKGASAYIALAPCSPARPS